MQAMGSEESQGSRRPTYSVIVNEPPKFELASYIANYKGRTILRRLYLIASCCPTLREEAARMLVSEAKRGNDVQIYRDAVILLRESSKGAESMDMSWLERKEKQIAAETSRLENELKGYKNNLIKESIRMGNEDLGTHYHQIGDLDSALKAFARMRDYCTSSAHIASTAFNIIAVGIEQSNWLAVQSQVHKIRNLQMKPEDATRNQPKTSTAQGLYEMCTGAYREAALSFLATEPGLGDTYNEVITSNDVAIYGGLCALAAMNRAELQSKVLENSSFRNFLELEPHIRRAINFFCAGKYSQCLEILESYRADYLLDIYLQNYVSDIYNKIRTKSIVQYFEPFSRVTLDAMAKTFAAPASNATTNGSARGLSIDEELIGMIESGTLSARIDLEARVLIAKESNLRSELHDEAHKTIEGFIREARMKLIRLNVVRAGLEVQAPPKGKSWDVDGWAAEGSFPAKGQGAVVGASAGLKVGARETRSLKGMP